MMYRLSTPTQTGETCFKRHQVRLDYEVERIGQIFPDVPIIELRQAAIDALAPGLDERTVHTLREHYLSPDLVQKP